MIYQPNNFIRTDALLAVETNAFLPGQLCVSVAAANLFSDSVTKTEVTKTKVAKTRIVVC